MILSLALMIIFVYLTKSTIVEFTAFEMWPLIFLIGVTLSIMIHAFIHELGHVFFGMLSGYKLDVFSIFGYTFIKVNGKYVHNKMSIPGTFGANLMHPKTAENKSYTLYVMGGVLATALLTIVSAILMNRLHNAPLQVFFYTMTIVGIFITLSNAFPIHNRGVYNDGMILRLFKKNNAAKELFEKSQELTLLTLKGYRVDEMPAEIFEIPEVDGSTPFLDELRFNRAEYLLHCGKVEEAQQELENVIKNTAETNKTLHDFAVCLLLLNKMSRGTDKSGIETLYNENKKDIQILAKYNLTAKYVRIAYRLKFENDLFLDNEIREFYRLAKKQGGGQKVELELMKKLLTEYSMTYLLPPSV